MVSLSDPICQSTALKAMAVAPKVTGIISLFSSTFIIQHVLRDRKRRSLTYHRLLLGMSISDFFGSLMCFLSTWPIPRGEACLAAGTTATCTAQGFFGQTAALCTPTYNISLAIYYILVIVKGWKEYRVSKIEKYLHAFPILAGFGTGFAALGLKLYNNYGWLCWIAPAPNNPDNFLIYQLAFLVAEAWAIIIFLAICMTIIYFHVLKQEKKLDKYSASFSQKKRKQSKKIRNQAFLYVGCMYMTWIFGSALVFIAADAWKAPPTFIIVGQIGHLTFFPLQGFFNLLIYMLPRILRHFEEGVPLTQSFKRRKSSFFSFLQNSISKRKRSQTQAETQVSCDEGNVETGENGEKGAALEDHVDDRDNEGGEGTSGENKIGGGDSGEDDEGDGETDAIDELEYIVEA
uniref:G-protein coupled receptors family 1 profile domain-containing protein n=1 Tax=Skeletonema marinoi TaxID=267567 RepID=A0A7S2LU29_9STRA|mmetsp:Transcript_288/g.429  ORF Transcript_288/g.429 Transcript_288/m.429 type:complete len:404 (+) Transcript_288:105-1316(+)